MGVDRCRLGVVLAALVCAVPAAADELQRVAAVSGRLTHFALLRETAREAVDEMAAGLPDGNGRSVTVLAGTAHRASWVVSELIASRLNERGYSVYIDDAPPSIARADRETSTAPVDSAAAGGTESEAPADSSAGASLLQALVAAENANAARTGAASGTLREPIRSAPRTDRVLEFRLGRYEVEYVDEGRAFFLGPKRVERGAAVEVTCRLLDGSGRFLWFGEGSAFALDTIPKGKLAMYESEGFSPDPIKSGGALRYVEPLVVGGIVAGLVVLFYTNQN